MSKLGCFTSGEGRQDRNVSERRLLLLLLLLCLMSLSSVSFAQGVHNATFLNPLPNSPQQGQPQNWTDLWGLPGGSGNGFWECSDFFQPCNPNNTATDTYNVSINRGNIAPFVVLNRGDAGNGFPAITVTNLSINGIGLGSSPVLGVEGGESLTVAQGFANSGIVNLDGFLSSGGSTITAGFLTNSGQIFIGDHSLLGTNTLTASSTMTVGGLQNTGAISLRGGSVAGAQALLIVQGAAPQTLTGSYNLEGDAGGAAVRFDFGPINQIGDGSSLGGAVSLNGSNAFMELAGQTGRNSALAGLDTIASNGSLSLVNGAAVSVIINLTNKGTVTLSNGGSLTVASPSCIPPVFCFPGGNLINAGSLSIDTSGNGGSRVSATLGLTNTGGTVSVGNGSMSIASKVNISGALIDGGGGTINLNGGGTAGAQALMTVNGAAPTVLTSNYNLAGNAGGAALQFSSGGISQIGDGSAKSGSISLNGVNAVIDIGASNNNNALFGLNTIASNGSLTLANGAILGTITGLTNEGSVAVNSASALDVIGNTTLTSTGSLTLITNSASPSPAAARVNVVGNLINNGNIFVDQPFAGTNNVSPNSGSVLAVTGDFTNTGKLQIDTADFSRGGSTVNVGGNLTNGGGTITLGTSLLAVNGSTMNVTADLTNSGTISLVTGGTTLTVGGNTHNSGSLTLAAGTTLNANAGYTQSGSTALTHVDGTLNLTTSSMSITGGVLEGSGFISAPIVSVANATVKPGTPLQIFGSLIMDSSSILDEALSGTTSNGTLEVFGALAVSNTMLSLEDLNGFVPTDGEVFNIADAAFINGRFSDNLIPFAGGQFAVSYATTGCAVGFSDCVDLTWSKSTPAATPEPSSYLLFASGLVIASIAAQRRKLGMLRRDC